MNFNTFTKEQVLFFFNFISDGKGGIPQSSNNIISGFLGYLYLAFGDLFIDNVINSHKDIVRTHKIIRYVDDVHISIVFNHNITRETQDHFINSIASQIAEILYSELELKLNMKTELYRPSKKEDRERLLRSIKYSSPSNEHFRIAQEDESEEEMIETPQEKLDAVIKELERVKTTSIEDYLKKGNNKSTDILQDVLDKEVEEISNKKGNRLRIEGVFDGFNFDLVKVKPLPILVLILKNDSSKSWFKSFCLEKKTITIWDADLILHFLCQTNFEDVALLEKLKQNSHMSAIIDMFLNAELHCSAPGCYNLSCMQVRHLASMPDVIAQTRLRVINEKSESYSVAINHLVNEIHAVCIHQEKKDKKKYDVNDVVRFISKRGVRHETCIKVRNLFDRRNSNQVSHPGSSGSLVWGVSKEEYLDYYEHVGVCIQHLL